MTVKELISKLDSLPQEYKVYLSSDEEGNRFHPLFEVEESYFIDEEYECEAIHPDDADESYPKAVVLWP